MSVSFSFGSEYKNKILILKFKKRLVLNICTSQIPLRDPPAAGEVTKQTITKIRYSDIYRHTHKRRVQATRAHMLFLINPKARWIPHWDVFLSALLVFIAIVTPYEVAFLDPSSTSPLFVANKVIDVFFVLEIFITFSTPIQDPLSVQSNIWISNRLTIAKMYIKGWFFIDFVSIVPFDVLSDAFGAPENLRIVRVAKLLKLAKLLRVLKSLRIVDKYSNVITLSHSTRKLITFVTLICVLSHWYVDLYVYPGTFQ